MEVSVNLNEVKEKPLLHADVPLTFAITKASLDIAKQPNKKTGVKEPYIKCEMVPLNPEWSDGYVVYQNWSLSPGALSSPDPTFSIKKFFEIIGFQWNPAGSFNTEDLQTIRFVGKVKYKEGSTLAQLASVLQGSM